MLRAIGGFSAGALFSAGLLLSGMTNPGKVMAFLDVAGNWDPSLAFVMAGAVLVTAVGYRLVLRRERPFLEANFALPSRRDIDRTLVVGTVIFGIGWGIGGYCPGPAVVGLAFGSAETIAFVVAMLVGMIAARTAGKFLSASGQSA